jgi:hypothetical protein
LTANKDPLLAVTWQHGALQMNHASSAAIMDASLAKNTQVTKELHYANRCHGLKRRLREKT